jgi:hypothetical protein
MPVSAIRKTTRTPKSPRSIKWSEAVNVVPPKRVGSRDKPKFPRRKSDVGVEDDPMFEERVESVRDKKMSSWHSLCARRTCGLGIHSPEDYQTYQDYAEQRMEHYADLADLALRNRDSKKYMELMKFVRDIFYQDMVQLDHCAANGLFCGEQRRTSVATKPVARIPSQRKVPTSVMIRDYEHKLSQ